MGSLLFSKLALGVNALFWSPLKSMSDSKWAGRRRFVTLSFFKNWKRLEMLIEQSVVALDAAPLAALPYALSSSFVLLSLS